MAYGTPGGGGSDDYFMDGGNTAAPAEKGESEASEEHATGLLPKALMGGKDFQVGEEIVLKITAIHENDFEVEYAHDEGSEKGGDDEMASAAPPPQTDQMASMME